MMRRLSLFLLATAAAACSRKTEGSPELRNPAADSRAPDTFRVAFETGKGRFVVEAVRAWAPLGVDRFHHLASIGYYDGDKFFRVVPEFVVQFGMHGEPAVNQAWHDRTIADDPVAQSNNEGYVTFAMGGPATRTTQLFISLKDNTRLDAMGFAPIGRVVEGMDVVKALYSGYGDGPPRGAGPEQDLIAQRGNDYLNRSFPQLDSIARARVMK